MEQELLNMSMELCRDPMVAVLDGILTGFNRAAAQTLPGLRKGERAAAHLPETLLDCPPDSAVSLTRLGTVECSVCCQAHGALRLYAATPLERDAERGFLSDGVMNRLLSGVNNLGAAVGELDVPDAAKRARNRAVLNRSCHILMRQLGDLRTALGLLEGTLPIQPRDLDLVSRCRGLCRTVGALTEDLGTALRFETEEPELHAVLDATLLERMLLNLLCNSFAHTPAEGTVLLRLERRGGAALLTVADNGSGIPPEVLGRVFQRYAVRATVQDLSPAATGGLGLYIVSGLARLMQGTMMIESRVGEGTTVRLSLPRNAGEASLKDPVYPPEQACALPGTVRQAFAELLPWERFSEREMD